jgi:hypothetical protein
LDEAWGLGWVEEFPMVHVQRENPKTREGALPVVIDKDKAVQTKVDMGKVVVPREASNGMVE